MSVSSSKYFTYNELKCNCGCGKADMSEIFMSRMDVLREAFDNPIYLNSAYRCPEYNSEVGGVDDSPHVRGIAVDIKINSTPAWLLLIEIMNMKFSGVGIKQHGKHKGRFLHIDDKSDGTRPWVWTYK